MQGSLRIVDFAVQIVDLRKTLLEYHGHNALSRFNFAHALVTQVYTASLNIDTGFHTLICDRLADFLFGNHFIIAAHIEKLIALANRLING